MCFMVLHIQVTGYNKWWENTNPQILAPTYPMSENVGALRCKGFREKTTFPTIHSNAQIRERMSAIQYNGFQK